MFDPRSDLIGLFTNSRIGAASRFSTASVYIQLIKEEVDNMEIEPNDYGRKNVGLMWLKTPREPVAKNIKVGTGTIDHEVVVDFHLIIPRNNTWLKNIHATYINSILATFEATIETNSTSSAGKSWDVAEPPNILSTNAESPNLCFRMGELVFRKTN